MDWAYILVIILSVFLAIFLLLGIILAIMLIRVTMQIRSITDSAQRTALNIESVVKVAKKYGGAAFVTKAIVKQAKKIKSRKKKKEDGDG